jgi:hypothetical protein
LITNSRLGEIRQALNLMDGVTPAAAIASELLREVDRLRPLVPVAATAGPSCPVDAVAKVMNVAPRTVAKWVHDGRLKTLPDGSICPDTFLEFLRSHGTGGEKLAAAKAGLIAGLTA